MSDPGHIGGTRMKAPLCRLRQGVVMAHGCALKEGASPADQIQARLNTSEPLVPPKPKLFFSAASIFMERAVLAQ